MNTRDMEKLTKHFERCFGQKNDVVMHNGSDDKPHIDVLVFGPTQKYPFWKLCTMGASDYLMPKRKEVRYGNTASLRNEYIIFLDPSLKVEEGSEDWIWYWKVLIETALFSYYNKEGVIATDTIDFAWDGESMQGVILLFPEAIEDTSILQCKMGMGRRITCHKSCPSRGPR